MRDHLIAQGIYAPPAQPAVAGRHRRSASVDAKPAAGSAAAAGDGAGSTKLGFLPGLMHAFSPPPMLALWKSRKAEFALPETDEHQPTEERFMYLLRKQLSRKPENRLSERERKELERVRAKLSAEQFQACADAALQQRKELKALPKTERNALESVVRIRTEMQMLELELRGSDVHALEHAVTQFEKKPDLGGGTDTGGASSSERNSGDPVYASNINPNTSEPHAKAARTLVRELLRALIVERARSSRLEQLLAEQVAAASFPRSLEGHPSDSSVSLSRQQSGSAGLSRQTSDGGQSERELSPTLEKRARAMGTTPVRAFTTRWPLSPLSSPLLPISAGRAFTASDEDFFPLGANELENGREVSKSTNSPIIVAAERSRRNSGSNNTTSSTRRPIPEIASLDSDAELEAAPVLVGFSSPLAKRVHVSIESEVSSLQSMTEQILAGADGSELGAGLLLAQMAAVAERSLRLNKDIRALSTLTRSSERREALGQLGALLGALDIYLSTFKDEVRGADGAALESVFEALLATHKEIVEVPSDGDCLFHSLAHALRTRAPLASNISASELRARCANRVRSHPSLYESELRFSASEALSSIPGGDGSSGSSTALLYEALVTAHGPAPNLKVGTLKTSQIGEAYASVIERAGVFGQRLELMAMSDELSLSLHLYYRVGHGMQELADSTKGGLQPPQPAEVVYFLFFYCFQDIRHDASWR